MDKNKINTEAVSKPVHIENSKKLVAAMARRQAQSSASDQYLAAKQARQHQRLNTIAERGNRK